MRIAIGLLAALSAGALTPALADPPSEPSTAATAAAPEAAAAQAAPIPADQASAASTDAAAQATAAKAAIDKDTRHFLAEGYKPEMHGGEQIYCKRETALGSRLAPVKNCGTIEQLKLAEQKTKAGVFDAQRQQTNSAYH